MKQLSQNELAVLSEFTKLNPFLFNKDGLINHENTKVFEIKRLNECVKWNDLYDIFVLNPNSQIEIEITENKNNPVWVLIIGQSVTYENQTVILAYFYNISSMKRKSFELERSTRLRALMLEVTQSIFIADSIEEIFDLSLANSIKALEKSNYGSIMVKHDQFFKAVSYIGFPDDIVDFNLPCDESFLAKNTEGKMDRFVRLNEDQLGTLTNFKIDDTEHMDYTDHIFFAQQLKYLKLIGKRDMNLVHTILCDYHKAFFDYHLLGKESKMLEISNKGVSIRHKKDEKSSFLLSTYYPLRLVQSLDD